VALKTAALIRDSIVVNAAVYDEATSGPWLDAIRDDYDSVLIVDKAGIGWEEYEPGKLRTPAPTEDSTWDDDAGEWLIPEPS